MTIEVILATSIVLHLGIFSGHTNALMRPNVRATPISHSIVAIKHPYTYVKFESCPSTGPLNTSCSGRYEALRARFGPTNVNDLIGPYQAVSPPDACEDISPTHVTATTRKYVRYIAIINRDNCSFEMKVYNAEKAGYRAVIIYANKEDKDLLNMSSSTPSLRVTIPAFSVSHDTGTMLAYSSKLVNTSRPSLLLIATRNKPFPPNFTGKLGAINTNNGEEEDGDNFGEHYFHICIYIWACVVVSSLIGLSVKWGCCGRSLTRWEVTKIPLKRFRRNSASDYQDKCPICHEEFHEGRLIRQLPCNHCYHSYCVDRWLVKMSNRCPLCKQRVSVSLFCSWSKQRDGQGGLQQSDADLDAEEASVVGELPPLPPVQSLTPNTLYGDAIMSGPSKFILMRPGKATRVIEVPKKEINTQHQNKQCIHSAIDGCQQHPHQQQQQTHAIVSTPSSRKRENNNPSPSDKSSVTIVSPPLPFLSDSKNLTTGSNDNDVEDNDKFAIAKEHAGSICMETLHHHHLHHQYDNQLDHVQNITPHKSSRSSSITSEHPLLTEEDRGSIVSLHSINDCILSEEGDGERQSRAMHYVNARTGSTGNRTNNKGESRCVTDKSCVRDGYPHSVSTHNRKMESSDSSDYGCNCDFIDEERVLYDRIIGSSVRRDGRDDDDTESCRSGKKVALEVNVSLNPQFFHADVEQHYNRISHPEQLQEQQLLLKGDNSKMSSSFGHASGIDCSKDVCTLNLFGDDISTSNACVNSCKNDVGDGRNSNKNDNMSSCRCGLRVNDVWGQGASRDNRCRHCSTDGCQKNSSEACGVVEGNKTKGWMSAFRNTDSGDCRCASHSLFKDSCHEMDTIRKKTATSGGKKRTRAADVNGMCNSYSASLLRVVATWDDSLQRGLSKKYNKRRYRSSSTSAGKFVKTL